MAKLNKTIMNDPKIGQVIAQHHSVETGLKQKESMERLKENFDEEIDKIDFRHLVIRAIAGMRGISPKVNGIEMRDQEREAEIRNLYNKNEKLTSQISELKNDLDAYKAYVNNLDKSVAGSINHLHGEIEEVYKTIQRFQKRIKKEENKKPFLGKIREFFNA